MCECGGLLRSVLGPLDERKSKCMGAILLIVNSIGLSHVRNSDPDDWRDSYIVVTAVAVMVLDDVSGRSGSCVLRIEGHCLRER